MDTRYIDGLEDRWQRESIVQWLEGVQSVLDKGGYPDGICEMLADFAGLDADGRSAYVNAIKLADMMAVMESEEAVEEFMLTAKSAAKSAKAAISSRIADKAKAGTGIGVRTGESQPVQTAGTDS